MARVHVQVPVEKPKDHDQASPEPPTPKRVPLLTGRNIVLAVIALAVLTGFALLINDRNKLKEEVEKQSTSQTANGQNDALKYQEEVGKIVELPPGQTPSLVTVSDAKKLASENAFFKNAQDGDIVLLYVSEDRSVRAILYRPSTKKVVEATSSATIGSGTQPVPATNR